MEPINNRCIIIIVCDNPFLLLLMLDLLDMTHPSSTALSTDVVLKHPRNFTGPN